MTLLIPTDIEQLVRLLAIETGKTPNDGIKEARRGTTNEQIEFDVPRYTPSECFDC